MKAQTATVKNWWLGRWNGLECITLDLVLYPYEIQLYPYTQLDIYPYMHIWIETFFKIRIRFYICPAVFPP